MSEREQFEKAFAKITSKAISIRGMAWAVWQAATQRQQERIAELEAQVQALSRDADRLNWIECEYVQVDTFAMPTGGDDADVGWTLKEWHEGECVPRLIHRHYRDDLREAIDAAIAAQGAKT